MDKDWMQIRNRTLLQYRRGVKEFLDFAFSHTDEDKIHCPCFKCNNCQRKSREDVELDLLSHGIVRNYTIWYYHGEDLPESSYSSSFGSDDDVDREDMEDMLRDHFGAWDIEEPNEDAAKFYKLLDDSEKSLYPGCSRYSKLSFLMRLLHIKCIGGWSNKSFSMLLELLNDAFPVGVQLPKSYYEARRIIRDLGLDYVKIDACPNDCMLFWKDGDNKKDDCDHCGASKWKFKEKCGKKKKIPEKILRYFPITPRLKRLYMSRKTALDMTWHHDKRIDDGILRHPADSKAWKLFDELHESFAMDPRNVRLGLASDGFNPFGNMSTKYSVWPMVLVPYNLPPWKCMKDPYLMLSLLIPGPKGPGNAIDTYLQPLVEELKGLWEFGVDTFDACKKQNFMMRAAILWTINDFPAYGNLSGWNTSGALRCPSCNVETRSKFLKNGNKFCFLGHRRFLPIKHRWRYEENLFDGTKELGYPPKQWSSDDIFNQVCELEGLVLSNQKDKKKKRKRKEMGSSNPWLKRSIFFELPYWRTLLLRHNLDAMHIEKNVCDIVLGTMMDIPGKSKDNLNSRLDLEEFGIREELHPIREGEVMLLPEAIYKLTNKERKSLCEFLKDVKVPDGYSSNIGRCINLKENKIYGLKSHDCHVLLECFLPLALRGLLSSQEVCGALIEFCNFFKELCSKVLTTEKLDKIEKQIINTLCKLEMIFPPSFFDVMVHLPIHLAGEAKIAGPVHYRWMYPIERYLYTLKAYVRNRAYPEGSIAEGYLANECLLFCSRYFSGIETKHNQVGRNWDGAATCDAEGLSIFIQNGRPTRNCKVSRSLSLEEVRQAHLYVLKNCDEVTPFILEHKFELETENPRNVEKRHDQEFSEWFESRASTSKMASYAKDKGVSNIKHVGSAAVGRSNGLQARKDRTNANLASSSHSQIKRQRDSSFGHNSKANIDSAGNDDGSHGEDATVKCKKRGPTRNLALSKLPNGKRLDIKWRHNRPVGPNANLLKSRCTVLVRDIANAPLKVKEWSEIPAEKRIKMFELVLEKFKVEGQQYRVWAQMNTSYRNYRCKLKKKYFEAYDDPRIVRRKVPPEIAKDDWEYLVDLWCDEDWQKMSQQNKMNRTANKIIHTTGSKGVQQRAEEAFEQTGQEIGRLRLWEVTHTRADGEACNDETQDKLDQIKELSDQVNEGLLEMNEHEVMVEVFGPERHGRVRGYGAGVTLTQLWGPNSSLVCDLSIKLQESERKFEESKAEVDDLKKKVDHMAGILEQILEGRMPVFRNNIPTFDDHPPDMGGDQN